MHFHSTCGSALQGTIFVKLYDQDKGAIENSNVTKTLIKRISFIDIDGKLLRHLKILRRRAKRKKIQANRLI